ncbi:hypothetical protein J4226_00175 [Candidatus Pacearchaeota archaeon]|nr:hypothetical protein [Candidatus Pacearchaeota archaeon]
MQKQRGLNFEALKEKCATIGELLVITSQYQTLSKTAESCIFLISLSKKEQGATTSSPCLNPENFAEALIESL